MYNFDFNAHNQLSNGPKSNVQHAIETAIEKSDKGHFLVCITNVGDVLVLPEFSASVRNDIAQVVYDTDAGYSFASN